MSKVVYFATGTPERAAADLRMLRQNTGAALRVVAPAASASEVARLASLPAEQVLPFSASGAAFLWIRLCMFVGFDRHAMAVCPTCPTEQRALKAISMLLPAKIVFLDGEKAPLPCSRIQLFWLAVSALLSGSGPICIIGSASDEQMARIIDAVRKRHPGVPLHGIINSANLRSAFDSSSVVGRSPVPLVASSASMRFQRVIIPCTGERHWALRLLALLLPVFTVECYNENLDAFSARNPYSLLRHFIWRLRQQAEARKLRREAKLALLPVGIVGSASAYYLKKIVPLLRKRFPNSRVEAVIPVALQRPAGDLFDSCTVLDGSGWSDFLQLWRASRQPMQCWIVPWTDEPYRRLKFLALLLPFRRRNVYNELADGFAMRDTRHLWGHIVWRARDQMLFQIFAGAAGNSVPARSLHLFAYGIRLLSAVPLLIRARLRPLPHPQSEIRSSRKPAEPAAAEYRVAPLVSQYERGLGAPRATRISED